MADPQTDPIADLLRAAPTSQETRAAAWDAFHQSTNQDDLAQKLQTLPLPKETKAALWDAKMKAGSPSEISLTIGGPSQPAEDNSVGTFLSHVGSQINPIPAVQAVGKALIPEAAARAMGASETEAPTYGPLNTLSAIGSAQGALFDKAKAAYEKGNYVEAGSHLFHFLLPIVGPSLDTAGTKVQHGEFAAGLGDAVGLGLSLVGPEAIAAARRGAPVSLANRLEQSADTKFADVMSPKGSSKAIQRIGKQAADIAGPVREGTTAITPGGLQSQIGERLSAASDALGDAYDAIPTKLVYSTKPLLSKLQAAIDALTVQGTGGSVVSDTQAPRLAALKQAMQEVQQIGPFTNTKNMARLRNNWKIGSQDAFVPSLNPNFQQIRQAAQGWADAWSALQETLTNRHPELKPLNADYHVWKQATDVMQALEDQVRTKPTVGRTIMARAGGAAVGAGLGGPKGALAGEVVGPLAERGLSQTLAPATKLMIARQLGKLAAAIRSGNVPRTAAMVKSLRPMLLAKNVLAQARGSISAPTLVPATAAGGQ